MANITYLSPAIQVNMDNAYFEMASLDHFWIRRRLETLQSLWGGPAKDIRLGDVGCGNGVVLQQFLDAYGVAGDGFDLNEVALKRAVYVRGRVFFYNIHDRLADFRGLYDVIILFDVIEHIEDDKAFLESVLAHLRPNGTILLNVPAHQALFSKYDSAQGHQRRYDISQLRQLSEATGLRIEAWTYWGFMYLPILWLRKKILDRSTLTPSEILSRGFSPGSSLVNSLLYTLGRMEICPNSLAGTSLMAVLRPQPKASSAAT